MLVHCESNAERSMTELRQAIAQRGGHFFQAIEQNEISFSR